MSPASALLPRFRRARDAPNIQLTSRDQEIVEQVFRHRFLRSTHITMLVPGSRQHVLRRLQRLYHHGYLDRPRCQVERYAAGSKAMVCGVGNKGIRLLEEHLGIPRRKVDWTSRNRSVSRYFLDHTLAVADITVKLELACRSGGGIHMIHARQLHESPVHWRVSISHHGTPVTVGVVPDAVFGLRTSGQPDAWLFLEADRATMPVARQNLKQTSLVRKLLAYHETWRQKVLSSTFPRFRVLVVTTSPDRIQHLIEAHRDHLHGQGAGLFLFTDRAAFLASDDPWHAAALDGRGESTSLAA